MVIRWLWYVFFIVLVVSAESSLTIGQETYCLPGGMGIAQWFVIGRYYTLRYSTWTTMKVRRQYPAVLLTASPSQRPELQHIRTKSNIMEETYAMRG